MDIGCGESNGGVGRVDGCGAVGGAVGGDSGADRRKGLGRFDSRLLDCFAVVLQYAIAVCAMFVFP